MSGNMGMCGKNIRGFEDYLSNSKYTGTIYQSWIKSLPSELRLSKSLRNVRLPIGIIVQISALTMFLFFLITGIENSNNASFLSMDKAAGDCSDVKISISGSYFVDYNGYWSTSPKYNDDKATFEIKFTEVEMNHAEYEYFIQDILYSYLKNLNMKSKTWVENMLIWTKSDTFEFNYGGGIIQVNIMSVPFTYKNSYYSQDCSISSGTCQQAYDAYSTYLSPISFSSFLKIYNVNEKNPYVKPDNSYLSCELTPNSPSSSNFLAGFGIDIYNVFNSGGFSDNLIEPYYLSSSNNKNTVPWVFQYEGSSGMYNQQDYCSTYNPNSKTINFPIIGTGLFNAATNQTTNTYYNTLSTTSADCNVCSSLLNSNCYDPNKLSLFVGILDISYSGNVQCQTYDANTGLYSNCAFENFYTQKALDDRANLNTKLFSLIDIYNTNYNITTLTNDQTLKEYLNFDAIQNVHVTQFTVENIGVYDSLNYNGGLNAKNVDLTCSDSLGELGPFKLNSPAITTPPTQLIEKYYVCTPSASTAFLDSFGIAASNTGTFMGIFLTIIITAYVSWIKYASKRDVSAVTSDDIESMVEILGTALVNRSIAREKKQTLPSGVISSISNELIDEENAIEQGIEQVEDVELSSFQNPYLQQAGK